MSKKKCSHCGSKEKLSINARYTKKNGEESLAYICRKCNTARLKERRKDPEMKQKIYEAIYKSIERHPDRQNARYKINYEVKMGRIKKPNICPCCNKEKPIEAHHDDYTKPLEVKWMCRTCHADLHRKIKSDQLSR